MTEYKEVKVFVRGGVVQDVSCPGGVMVKVYDYDISDFPEPGDLPNVDDDGEPCSVSTYIKAGT